jgi:hypothetical protein
MLRSIGSIRLLILALVLLASASSFGAEVSVGVSIQVGPPELPVYEQPECPASGYLWAPGYWAYGPDGYYWVPGTWVAAPRPGLLWTPGYWGWARSGYFWHEGYWGPHVGFYGGIRYGFGYTGNGFSGGYWKSGAYCYNRAVTNVNVTVVHNTYTKTVVNNTAVGRVSFNGGAGGTLAKPNARELVAARESHVPATAEQMQHRQTAGSDRELLASANHGQPALAKRASAPAAKEGEEAASVNHSSGKQGKKGAQNGKGKHANQKQDRGGRER